MRTQTLTASLPEFKGERADICTCTAIHDVLTEPQPQEVAYPPLPEDATEVEVTLPGLDPVTVPVSR